MVNLLLAEYNAHTRRAMDIMRSVKDDGSSDNIANNLKRVIKEYGAIVITIIDGNVDKHAVETFIGSLSQYHTITNNPIGSWTNYSREYNRRCQTICY